MGSACILWTKAVGTHGYGVAWDRQRKRTTTAHRAAYERVYGPIPPKHDVHHTCGVKLCVNPDHLVALTRAKHMRGDNRHRLTAEQVVELRRLRAERHLSYRALGRLFGVTYQHARLVVLKKRWDG